MRVVYFVTEDQEAHMQKGKSDCRHQFSLQRLTVPIPTFCDVCGDLLWVWQGKFWCCMACELKLHKKCHTQLVSNDVETDWPDFSAVHTHELKKVRLGVMFQSECAVCTKELQSLVIACECVSCDFVCHVECAGADCNFESLEVFEREESSVRDSVVSEVSCLASLLSRRNSNWKLALLNPLSVPLLMKKHSDLYTKCCEQLQERSKQSEQNRPTSKDLTRLRDSLRFATAVYGLAYRDGAMRSCARSVTLRVQQDLLTPKNELNNRAVTEILGLPRESLLLAQWSREVFKASYCVVCDRELNQLVLAFRGSLTDGDFLTDACSVPTPFCDGHAHEGMCKMVEKLFGDECPLKNCLSAVLNRFQDLQLVITGHSLGGGLAQLCGLKLLYDCPEWLTSTRPGVDVTEYLSVVAFAPPPVLTRPMADRFDKNISCVVAGTDLVCRLQLNTLDRLANEFSSTSSSPSSHDVGDLSEELNLVGKVWLLTHPTSKNQNRIVLVPRGHHMLHQIFVSPSAISNHLMDCYANGLSNVVE